MRKHHILIVTLSLVAAACSSASSTPTTSSTTSLVITTTSTTPPTTSVMAPPAAATSIEVWVPGILAARVREAAAAFERDTAIGVEVTAVEIEAVLDQLLADPASGPSVFVGPHTWLTTLTDAGIAEPLPSRSEVVAGAVAAVTMRGVALAAPLALDTIVQFRDTDVLPVAPDTIESLAAGCSDDATPCLVLATNSVDAHYPFIAGTGGYVFGPDEFEGWNPDDVGVDSAAAITGGLILQAIVDGAGILDEGASTAEDRFVAGDAPLLWGGVDSLAALNLAGIGFTVERLPTIAGAPAPTPIRVTAAWVNAFSPAKEAATTFVVDYLAAPSSADPIAVALGLAPVNVGFDADPDLLPFIESARTGNPVPTIFETDFAWEQLAIAFDDIRRGDEAAIALVGAAGAIRNAPEPEAPEAEGAGS